MSARQKDSKFASPEKNAKGCGVILVIFGVITLLVSLFAGAFVTGSDSLRPLGLISGVLLVIAGAGISKFKKYGLHLLLVLTALEVLIFLYNLFVVGYFRLSFALIIWPLVFIWLYQTRDKFK